MTLFDSFRPAQALSALLAKEREAVLTANFDYLAKLEKPKQTLLQKVGNSKTPPDILRRLIEKSEENNRLLAAAAKGVRAAHSGLKSASQKTEQFNTYDLSGRTFEIGQRTTSIKKNI